MSSAALIPVAPTRIATYLVRFPLICQSYQGLLQRIAVLSDQAVLHDGCGRIAISLIDSRQGF
jgi:hypothetical protein